jgi:hypothetical protein
MRTIKAIFEIQEDSDLAGVHFECDGKTMEWQDLSRLEQIRMLNAWLGHRQLFERFVKKEEQNETN